MAPTTRSNPFRTPSPISLDSKEATTRRKYKFFDATFDNLEGLLNTVICKKVGITEGCGRKWLRQYKEYREEARRRLRPQSVVLGRKLKVTKQMCQTLVSPSRNPLRKHPYAAQIEYFNIPVEECQLQRKMKEYTKGGGRYVMVYVEKVFSEKN
jgi:transposase